MNSYKFFLLSALSCATLVRPSVEELFEVVSDPDNPFHDVSEKDFYSIKTENELSKQGTLAALVSQRNGRYRKFVPTLSMISDHRDPFKAVTLMRMDVSKALGGPRVTGDALHVHNLHLGCSYLFPGDLLTISDPETSEVHAILLKTYVEYYADDNFAGICGQRALEFLNAEGRYRDGWYKQGYKIPCCNRYLFKSDFLHGRDHRLRGVALAVLLEGEIAVGDLVTIVRSPEKYRSEAGQKLLEDLQLAKKYDDLLGASMITARLQKTQEDQLKQARAGRRWEKLIKFD